MVLAMLAACLVVLAFTLLPVVIGAAIEAVYRRLIRPR